jgi:hypothetical protein
LINAQPSAQVKLCHIPEKSPAFLLPQDPKKSRVEASVTQNCHAHLLPENLQDEVIRIKVSLKSTNRSLPHSQLATGGSLGWIIEPDDEATNEAPPVPVGVPVMVITLRPDGEVFGGVVTNMRVSPGAGGVRMVELDHTRDDQRFS